MVTHKKNLNNKKLGSVMIYSIIALFVMTTVLFGLVAYGTSQLKVIRGAANAEQALQVADAGINYYQWHLAHYPTDYSDGNAGSCNPCGPYSHNYTDANNNFLGKYNLTVYPPASGSNGVKIESIGTSASSSAQKRKVTSWFGVPAWSRYAFYSNDNLWVGPGITINGDIHSNNGIRFDGLASGIVSSSKQTYVCPSTICGTSGLTKPGIWGSAAASSQYFWRYPTPGLDFIGLNSYLSSLKTLAQSGGIYLSPSNAYGYLIVFNSNGTFSINKVTSLRANTNGIVGSDVSGNVHNESTTYSAYTPVSGYTNINIPSNGVIYAEDNVWVEGTIHGRATVAAAVLPYNISTAPNIILQNSILYSSKDGSDSLGLIGQKNVEFSFFSANNIEVDAALLAQYGAVQHFYWQSITKSTLTIYGSVGSNIHWVWNWLDSSNNLVSGYNNVVITYDPALLYAPPPNFPLTTDTSQQLRWMSD